MGTLTEFEYFRAMTIISSHVQNIGESTWLPPSNEHFLVYTLYNLRILSIPWEVEQEDCLKSRGKDQVEGKLKGDFQQASNVLFF